jgi:hypothetical protein
VCSGLKLTLHLFQCSVLGFSRPPLLSALVVGIFHSPLLQFMPGCARVFHTLPSLPVCLLMCTWLGFASAPSLLGSRWCASGLDPDPGFSHPDLAPDPDPDPEDSALGFSPDSVLQGFPSLLGSNTLALPFSVHSPFSVLSFFSI